MGKIAKKRDRSRLYLCTGESWTYRRVVACDDCGDTKSLEGWCRYLFKDEADKYLKTEMENSQIVETIYFEFAKRLEAVKGGGT